jgi:hypothetical protein
MKLARLLQSVLQAADTAGTIGKNIAMKTLFSKQPDVKGPVETTGTRLGATISMALIIAFGLSSYLNQQDKDINHAAAAEHSNRPTVISAYLA